MHWSAYEIFSVLSGIVLIIIAFFPDLSVTVKNRVWAVVGGLFFIVYGFYVAKQTSGTYAFPVWIFIIPIAGVAYLAVSIGTRRRTSTSDKGKPPQIR